jgi:hypothetical protein
MFAAKDRLLHGATFAMPGHPHRSSPHQQQPSPRVANAALCFQQTAHSFASPKAPTSLFSVSSALFEAREKCNSRVSSHFPTLCALFGTRAKINSFIFMRVRTILWKWGVGAKIERKCPPGRGVVIPSVSEGSLRVPNIARSAVKRATAQSALFGRFVPGNSAGENGCGLYLQPA